MSGVLVSAIQIVVVGFMPLGPAGKTGLVVAIVASAVQGVALWQQQDRLLLATTAAIVTADIIQVLYPPVASGGALPALFVVASLRPPRQSLWALLAVSAFAPFQGWAEHWRAGLVLACGAALTWALGELNRIRVVRRVEEARRITDAERARIASELHDVVAHHVSVVVVQAAAADDVFETRPDRSRAALRAIESTGRQALAELRRVVHTLPPEEEKIHTPGLSDVDELAESLRAAGVNVSVDRQAVAVSQEVGLAAYRIVQESLTNVVRHAAASNVEIAIRDEADHLRVDVHNDGTKRSEELAGTGRGIHNMRKRAHLLGGGLDAAANGGGFTVTARLPVTPSAAAR